MTDDEIVFKSKLFLKHTSIKALSKIIDRGLQSKNEKIREFWVAKAPGLQEMIRNLYCAESVLYWALVYDEHEFLDKVALWSSRDAEIESAEISDDNSHITC